MCDVRAATPTAAAELALPDIYSLNMHLANMDKSITQSINRIIENHRNRLNIVAGSQGFNAVKSNIQLNKSKLDSIKNTLSGTVKGKIAVLENRVRSYIKILESQSPINNLKKGYGLIYKDENIVKDYSFTVGESAKIVTLHQELECEVTKVKPRKV